MIAALMEKEGPRDLPQGEFGGIICKEDSLFKVCILPGREIREG